MVQVLLFFAGRRLLCIADVVAWYTKRCAEVGALSGHQRIDDI